jgi:hypothetical protein
MNRMAPLYISIAVAGIVILVATFRAPDRSLPPTEPQQNLQTEPSQNPDTVREDSSERLEQQFQ